MEEEGVVGAARVLGDGKCRGVGQGVRGADDEVVEGIVPIEAAHPVAGIVIPRLRRHRRGGRSRALAAARRRLSNMGLLRCRNGPHDELDGGPPPGDLKHGLLDRIQIVAPKPFVVEAVGHMEGHRLR